MAAQLRVFPASRAPVCEEGLDPNVRISLRELLPVLDVARRRNYLWLHDFLDDEVAVTSDLYDVIRAFQAYRPSA